MNVIEKDTHDLGSEKRKTTLEEELEWEMEADTSAWVRKFRMRESFEFRRSAAETVISDLTTFAGRSGRQPLRRSVKTANDQGGGEMLLKRRVWRAFSLKA